jgi:TRAP-type C4-dicarboxylate transport system permease small subunit
MNLLNKFNDFLVRVAEWLMVLFLTVMCVGVAAQMILRYFFSTSILQVEDIIKFSFSWLIFMGVAALFRNDEHIAVTALVDALPKKAGDAIYMLQRILTFAFLIGLFWVGLQFAETGFSSIGSQLQIPLFWVYVSVPIAAVFGICFYLEFFVGKIAGSRGKATAVNAARS